MPSTAQPEALSDHSWNDSVRCTVGRRSRSYEQGAAMPYDSSQEATNRNPKGIAYQRGEPEATNVGFGLGWARGLWTPVQGSSKRGMTPVDDTCTPDTCRPPAPAVRVTHVTRSGPPVGVQGHLTSSHQSTTGFVAAVGFKREV